MKLMSAAAVERAMKLQDERSTPEVLEDAVNRLTEPRGFVIQFKRRAS